MSYRNPITYVDSQSGKNFAAAIQSIGNSTIGLIDKMGDKAEEDRKKKEAESLKLLNDHTRFNLDYLNSANLSTKDFDLQPSLQPAIGSLVDEAGDIKARLMNSKDPQERAMLQKNLMKYESFFKGGGLKNLLSKFEEKRNLFAEQGVVGKAGKIGGVDLQKMDPKEVAMYLSTYSDSLPANTGVKIVETNGVFDIVMDFQGGQFEGMRKDGALINGYQQSLLGLQSSEIPIITDFYTPLENSLIENKYLKKDGMVNYEGIGVEYLTGGEKIEKIGGRSYRSNGFDREGFKNSQKEEVIAMLSGYSNQSTLDGAPASGFNEIESFYNNVLKKEGDGKIELDVMSKNGTSLSDKSLDIVVDRMTDYLADKFEVGIKKELVKFTPGGNDAKDLSKLPPRQAAATIYNEIARDPVSAYNRYLQGPETKAKIIEGSIIEIPRGVDEDSGEELDPLRYNMDNKEERAIFFQQVLEKSKLVGGSERGQAIRLEFPSIVDEMSDKYITNKTAAELIARYKTGKK